MGKCALCGKATNKSIGQLVFWHKECRTKGRRLRHRYLKGKT